MQDPSVVAWAADRIRQWWFPALLFLLPFAFLYVAWEFPTYFIDGYHLSTKHLAEKGIYSLDGVHPFVGKQPPGFSILSVPFYYVVGYPHATKASGAFWTALSALCLYRLLAEVGLAPFRRMLSLLFVFNPETVSSGAQSGISESAATFSLVAGVLLLVRYHADGSVRNYLWAGLALGYAPLIRAPAIAFTLLFVGYSLQRAGRLRAWVLPGCLLAILPTAYWITRPGTLLEPIGQTPVVVATDRVRSLGEDRGGEAAVRPDGPAPRQLPAWIPKSIRTYVKDILYLRAPEGERFTLLIGMVCITFLSEAARIYLLALPFVYWGAFSCLFLRRGEPNRLLPIVCGAWFLYICIHVAYGNVLPRYFLPVLPFSIIFAGIGANPLLNRPWGRRGLTVLLLIHAAISLPFAYGPAEDVWSSVLGVSITRRAKNLESAERFLRWANDHLPEGALVFDPGPGRGNLAAYRSDIRVVTGGELGELEPGLYFVNYSRHYIYCSHRLREEPLSGGSVALEGWITYRDHRRSLVTRNREQSRAVKVRPFPDLKAEIVFQSAGGDIALVHITSRRDR